MGKSRRSGSPLGPQAMCFDGQFTPSVRQELRHKRLSLGVTQERLAWILETNWSTFRKWEAGKTSACHDRYIQRINDFLRGAYDATLISMRERDSDRRVLWDGMSNDLWVWLVRVINLDRLCRQYPDLGECVVQMLKNGIGQVCDRLEQTSRQEAGLPIRPPREAP